VEVLLPLPPVPARSDHWPLLLLSTSVKSTIGVLGSGTVAWVDVTIGSRKANCSPASYIRGWQAEDPPPSLSGRFHALHLLPTFFLLTTLFGGSLPSLPCFGCLCCFRPPPVAALLPRLCRWLLLLLPPFPTGLPFLVLIATSLALGRVGGLCVSKSAWWLAL
jgi:hypothetical protein